MREHWASGLEDTRRTLKRRDWLAMPEHGMGIVVHDVIASGITEIISQNLKRYPAS